MMVAFRDLLRLVAVVPPFWRGGALMVAATLCFSAQITMIRHVSGELHPFEITFFRNVFGLVVVLPLFWRGGLAVLRTTKRGWHVLRSLLHTANMLFYFVALSLAPLTQNVALSFLAPLYAAGLAMLLLGEKASVARLLALLGGLAGAWIVIRPGFAEINAGVPLVLVSSACWGCAIAVTKYLTRTDSSVTVNVYMGLLMVPMSLIPALFVWEWPAPTAWVWLFLIGALGGVGHLALAQAFREADATALLPLDFSRILWVAILGYAVFGEVPDVWTLAGGAVIFAAAVTLALHEAKARRAGTP